MSRPVRTFYRVILVLLVALAIIAAFWFGLVPQRLSPFSPISLETRQWFVEPRLSSLRHDPELCQSVLKAPHIDATAIPDSPIKNGCGWTNAVRFSTTGGAKIGVNPLTCEMAAAVTLWVEHEVQPLAMEMFGKRVVALGDMGTYDCRNIVGSRNPFLKDMRSEHAKANALDISGFTLEDGRNINVLRDWSDKGPEGRFLHEAHRRACRYFRVTLGPEANEAHKNHFHFDRGLLWTCK
jgi:hypothetical protein